MSPDAWIATSVTLLILGLLALTRVQADLVFAGGLTLLLATGVLTPAEAFAGFANPAVLTVGVLYVVVAGLRDTGGLLWIGRNLLGRPRTVAMAQLRLMAPVTVLSAFLNNTPVVAMLIPVARDWGRKNGVAPSKLMIPLSYAAILGGTCTLIGTSTNLVVNGLLIERGRPGLGMFELAWVGVPTALVGLALVLFGSRWLLPDRGGAAAQLEDPREYSVEMTVQADGPLVGQSVEEAGLRALPGLYLVEIDRDGRVLPAVSPQEVLRGGDRLVFVGVVDSVVDLNRLPGLAPAGDQVFKLGGRRSARILIEAVVSDSGPLVGRSIREGGFRNHYDAVVIAVARNGERVRGKIGDIVLRPGDVLLLEARPGFLKRHRNSRDFYLVSGLEDSQPPRFERSLAAVVVLLGMVASVALGLLDMVTAAMLAAGLMILTRSTTGQAARRSVDASVLIVIAAAFGVGRALETTGVAHAAALGLASLAGSSPLANLLALYLATALFSAVITNNAAAVLLFPIASAIAADLNVDVRPFAIGIAMAASASFATPIGYQTNLMVYGPGGYRFADYLRIGVPLTVLAAAVAVLVIPRVWSF